MRRLLLAAFISLIAISAYAQSSRSQMNHRRVELRLQLAFANSDQSPKGLRVELMDSFGVSLEELRTDTEGKVTFRSVAPGDYRVVVTGEGVEESRGTIFTVWGHSPAHSELIHIFAKREGDAKEAASNAMISAASLRVPQKAREELDKGSRALAENDLDKARRHFEKAVEIYPEFSGAYNNLGVIHMQQGRRDEGKQAFLRALELDPDAPRPYVNLARIYDAERNYAEVDRLLTRYVSMVPTSAEALMMLARAQVAAGKLDAALENCRRVHDLPHKDQPRAHLLAGRILTHRKQPEDALRELRVFIEEAPNDPNAPEAFRMMQSLRAGGVDNRD